MALAAGLLLISSPLLAAKGGSKGKPPKEAKEKDAKPKEASDSGHAEGHSESRTWGASGPAIGRDEGRVIRSWFATPQNREGLPPGLAKRESLPPGLRRQIDRNGQLPPGLESKLHRLPDDLERSLPRLPDGYRRVIIDRDVFLVEEHTNRVRDVLRRVLPQ